MLNKLVKYVCAFLVIVSVQTVHAEDSLSSNDAKGLYTKAAKLFSEAKFIESAEKFREAYAAKPSWKIFYNIGQAESAAKRYGHALDAFESYLSVGGDNVSEERQAEIMSELKRLRGLVGSLDIEGEDGCVVFIDDQERGVTPLVGAIKIAAGVEHSLVVKQGEEVVLSRRIKLGGGDTKNITIPKTVISEAKIEPEVGAAEDSALPADEDLVIENKDVAPADATKSEVSQNSRMKIPGITLLTTGLAAAVAGGVTGGLALSKSKDLDSECRDNKCFSTSAQNKLDNSKALGVVSTILLPSGAVLAVTGIVLLLVNKRKSSSKKVALSVNPVISNKFSGFAIEGSF